MSSANGPVIEVDGLCHAYREGGIETPVLHDIDLAVRRGEFVALVGPSGCGKTTLLSILGLMMRQTSGRVRLDGIDTTPLGGAARTRLRRQAIGFVFQRFNLLPILTARGNIDLALTLRGVSPDGHATRLLDRVGLAAKSGKKPRALSIGEQQRVAIARAVACRPGLLLADEPTGNLDSANADAVLRLLRELHAEQGLTTIMITHNEALAGQADRVLRMRDGRLETA